ncbi:MAG: UDP-glucose 6-dehydrogenase [Bacteroidetes bacterium]|nr:MAG: UDP-glucose 6-dehydrogenase [Bacteroidota bacterium]
MNIAIIGTGYVGLVTGACFAELGIHVACIDSDQAKIDALRQGVIPIYEPRLETIVRRNTRAERLWFTTRLDEALPSSDLIFIAVGTPPDEDGAADLSHVFEVARAIGQQIDAYKLIVTKSTVPVGTAERVRETILHELQQRGLDLEFDVASNPEFLKEGDAVDDFMKPDRVVVGVDSPRARELMTSLYKPMLLNNFRVLFMDIPSAEMTKYAANAMLATRISFMNDIANLCERVGADANMVRLGIGSDTRIGKKFLYPGCGYGGSCFPKDVKALMQTGRENGYPMRVLEAVEAVNDDQKRILFRKFSDFYANELIGKRVTVWGLSFKPGTDDMREAPSLVLIDALLREGCQVCVYDPVAMEEAKRRLGDTVSYAKDIYDSALSADAIFHVTEWKEFRMPNWEVIRRSMRKPLIIDGRNVFDPDQLGGFTYLHVG